MLPRLTSVLLVVACGILPGPTHRYGVHQLAGHSFLESSDYLVIFGGLYFDGSTGGYLNDLWLFDVAAGAPAAAGYQPQPRSEA
ncbi:hypothetical protein AK812_SmicGene26353 [Symbiodinium microadriaticum]|uniref:Uncharacterized protein n=1 Tax=Symbiodinium microadriaticum TaxID=2951 RepID=A0A1Q9D9U6_SYMMI|nr:hypothetical protein AK812_SmicGene26353 [Symbiodinium microadriaticum]